MLQICVIVNIENKVDMQWKLTAIPSGISQSERGKLGRKHPNGLQIMKVLMTNIFGYIYFNICYLLCIAVDRATIE